MLVLVFTRQAPQATAAAMVSWLIVLSVTLLAGNYCVVPTWAQFGKKCAENSSCMPYETCKVGHCTCDHGYDKHLQRCSPVRGHEQECVDDNQCVDYRMMCAKRQPDDPVKLCICDQFHTWRASLQECERSMDTAEILSKLPEKYDNLEIIQREANRVFMGAIVAGSLVIIVGISLATVCTIYGCCDWEMCRSTEVAYKQEKSPKDPESPREAPVVQHPPGTSQGWQEVVSTVPVQSVILT